jgi:hypothetical protein
MIVNLYSVHDAKAEAYGNIFPMHTDNLATRSFQQAIQNPETGFQKDIMSYSLFRVGQWDDNLGLLIPEAPPKHIITAMDALSSVKKEQEMVQKLIEKGELDDVQVSNDE